MAPCRVPGLLIEAAAVTNPAARMVSIGIAMGPVYHPTQLVPDILTAYSDRVPDGHRYTGRDVDVVGDEDRHGAVNAHHEPLMLTPLAIVGEDAVHAPGGLERDIGLASLERGGDGGRGEEPGALRRVGRDDADPFL